MTKREKVQFILDWTKNPEETYSDRDLSDMGFNDFFEVLNKCVQVGCQKLLEEMEHECMDQSGR